MSSIVSLACAWQDQSTKASAEALAKSLDLPCIQVEHSFDLPYSYILLVNDMALQIQPCGKKPPGTIYVDFSGGAVAHRRQYGGGQGQMIAKACGITQGIRPSIADVTAGLGRDAFVLASLGCHVQMIERSRIIYHLLNDGLERASHDLELSPIIARMALEHCDAVNWLKQRAEMAVEVCPQVVYLDPMFPHREKSALVKKEMLVFRDIVGADDDADALLEQALQVAQCRVVVKRPRKAPCLMNRAPSYQLEGKSSRFDIYALKKIT